MLKTYWRVVSWAERAGDNFLIILSFILTYEFRDVFVKSIFYKLLPFPLDLNALADINSYFLVLGVALPVYNASLSILGAYKSMRRQSWFQILRSSFVSSCVAFLAIGSFLFLLKIDLSRSFVALFCFVAGSLLFLERFIVLHFLRFYRIRGKNFRNILIVGTGEQARKLYFEILGEPELGIRVQGFVDVRETHNSSAIYDLGARVIASKETFESTLKKHTIDEVIFTEILELFPIIQELSEIAVDEGVMVTFTADLFSLGFVTSEVSNFGKIPVIHYHPAPGVSDSLSLFFKRSIDLIFSSILLFLLIPVFIIVPILIKTTSKGPVFFRQKRVGLNGRIFTLLKFRSMVINAEELLIKLKDKNEMQGPVFKMTNDPRITKLGAFLRKYSIDELPQLINVIRGDMSLVGPRPPLPDEVDQYKRKQRKRLSMRPGLTCTWQVSGRSNILNFEDWAKLDLEYIDNWSLSRDIKLLIKTIPVVLFGNGAR